MARVVLQRNQLDWWIVVWFYATAIICTIDASFICFRPLTLPGGPMFNYFYPYKYYIGVDKRYSAVDDSYVFTQSLMNYVEVIINLVTIYMHYTKDVRTKLLAFSVSVMTFWKTVLYIAMFYELGGGNDFRQGNTLLQEILIVLIPNGVWIVIPYMCMVSLWNDILYRVDASHKHHDDQASAPFNVFLTFSRQFRRTTVSQPLKSFLAPVLKANPGIRKYQGFFKFSSVAIDSVRVLTAVGQTEKETNIMKHGNMHVPEEAPTAVIEPHGLYTEHSKYLHKTVRKYVRPVF